MISAVCSSLAFISIGLARSWASTAIPSMTSTTCGDTDIRDILGDTDPDIIRDILRDTDPDIIRDILGDTDPDIIRDILGDTDPDIIRDVLSNKTQISQDVIDRDTFNELFRNHSIGQINSDKLSEILTSNNSSNKCSNPYLLTMGDGRPLSEEVISWVLATLPMGAMV